jgi:hypothetical protein
MTDRLSEIFTRQKQFVDSLDPILHKNGLFVGHYPYPLDDRKGQEQFRLLAWRYTEEIIELVCLYSDPKGLASFTFTEHFFADLCEEAADALHFLIELCIATGITHSELATGCEDRYRTYELDPDPLREIFEWSIEHDLAERETPEQQWVFTVHKLGIAMHYLRQRPWRTDNRVTNRKQFVVGIHLTFRTFVRACIASGIDSEQLYQAYFDKGKINDERTASQKL